MLNGILSTTLPRNKSVATNYDIYKYVIEGDDPYLANVVLHLKGDGENNSTDIVDSSPNPKTITRFGDAMISIAQSKYGGSSIFQGTTGYLSVPMTYTTDFTIEAWLYITSYPSNSMVCGTLNSGNWHIAFSSRNSINVFINSHMNFTTTSPLPLNQWFHFVVTRTSNSVRAFINGIQQGTAQTNTTAMTGATMQIFKRPSDSLYLKGYIDSFRWTNIARYVANFNPETDTNYIGQPEKPEIIIKSKVPTFLSKTYS